MEIGSVVATWFQTGEYLGYNKYEKQLTRAPLGYLAERTRMRSRHVYFDRPLSCHIEYLSDLNRCQFKTQMCVFPTEGRLIAKRCLDKLTLKFDFT